MKNKGNGEWETTSWSDHRGRALSTRSCPKAAVLELDQQGAQKKKEISKLINAAFRKPGLKDTVVFPTS